MDKRKYANILYYDDSIGQNTLNKSVKKAILKYSNPNYWTGLLKNNQIKNFRYHKNQLKKLTCLKSVKTQGLISEVMSKKIDLINANPIQINGIYKV